MNVLRNNISTVQQASSHVLSVLGVTLDHLVVLLEAGHGDFLDGMRLVVGLGRGDNRGVRNKREMDTGIGDKVGLELIQIHIQRSVEAEGSSDGRNDYGVLVLYLAQS